MPLPLLMKAEKVCTVIKGNAVNVVERLAQQVKLFDFAFCDPPYNKGWIAKIINAMTKHCILKQGGYLIVERAVHDNVDELPACFELVRTEKYGETIIDFLYYDGEKL